MEPSPSWPSPRKSSVAMRNMFNTIASRYDLANRAMSLGRDPFWREALARRLKILESPGRLLDLAAGTGDQIVAAKKALPGLEAVGLDLSTTMMELAEAKFDKLSPPRPQMITGDALDLPFGPNEFDSVSMSFGLRNVGSRPKLFEEAFRVLKPGGRLLILEMYYDRQTPWAGFMNWYLKKIVPLVGGRLISTDKDAYKYLVASIMAFPRPEELAGEMKAAGFLNLSFKTYTLNTVMLVWGDKPLT
ncbi:dimethylmenaquinone methyltransferase [Deltaproteobacteria bacterium Smac51]|nr:dimethylmenaquinone methyltransferase [Deltaproteobacteria bacterium Smac51]